MCIGTAHKRRLVEWLFVQPIALEKLKDKAGFSATDDFISSRPPTSGKLQPLIYQQMFRRSGEFQFICQEVSEGCK